MEGDLVRGHFGTCPANPRQDALLENDGFHQHTLREHRLHVKVSYECGHRTSI